MDEPGQSSAVVGVVIAGGRSVRFGGEKAVAVLAGKPLLLWAVRRLQRSCAVVAVNARPGTDAEALAKAEGLTVLHDAPGDAAGPLAGVKVGLQWARDQGARALAVSPCDVPLLPVDLFARLIAAASQPAQAGSGAAMAETAEGHQPLCAVWPISALDKVTQSLANGAHPATWLVLDTLRAVRVRFQNPQEFINVNTRGDLATIQQRFEMRDWDAVLKLGEA
ncbi:MAG TPA: molybdenum cofactor guanylyltransferase [Steroidobacteraceae bacterium]|jgi:molybdopterin-guanine dinucleotide biosynthesis protein A